jgi:hypothetical protein
MRDPEDTPMVAVKSPQERAIAHYFEASSSGVEVVQDGLQEVPFGEFLVDTGKLSRSQLLSAMMFQDRNPGVRIGECVAALGFVPYEDVDRLFAEYAHCDVVELA